MELLHGQITQTNLFISLVKKLSQTYFINTVITRQGLISAAKLELMYLKEGNMIHVIFMIYQKPGISNIISI